jgi:hypothetical protein
MREKLKNLTTAKAILLVAGVVLVIFVVLALYGLPT